MSSRTIVAVEIGSSKIKAAVGEVADNGTLTVCHIEEERQSPNFVRYGMVQNIKEVSNSLNRIIFKLTNRISPARISAVYAGVGGRSMMALKHHVGATQPDDTEITPEIIGEILGRAENIIDPERKVVEVLPGEFMVDNMKVADPVGTIGNSISTEAMVVSCRQQMLRNLQLAVNDKLNIKIHNFVVRHTAIAGMVLTDDERQLGVMLVDFGAETTAVSIYKDGFLKLFVTIPLGSRHITRDIMSRGYSEERADEIKRTVGNAMPEPAESNRLRHEGLIDDSEINNLVAARAGEIVINILERVKDAGLRSAEELLRGIVVTGLGANLNGFTTLLENQSGVTVRRAAMPATVRRGNSRIRLSSDDIDVVALLHHLASQPTRECVVVPPPVVEEPEEPDTVAQDNDIDSFDDDDVEAVGGKRRSFFSSWRDKIKNIIDPQDIDTSDESFDD